MKKSFYVILIFFTNCLAANATIKIGTPIYDPPYAVYGKISGVSGADINLMNIICNRLGWDCEYVPMKYDQLLSALDENKIDFAIGALIIPEEKQNKYIYTLPYMISQAGFLTMTTSPIHSIKELQNKRVGVLQGRGYHNYLYQNFLDKFTIITYKNPRKLLTDLRNGTVDAIFANYLSVLYLEHQYPTYIKALREPINVGNGLGIAALPDNQRQVDQINNIILQLESDGTFIKLYNYNFEFID